jgi:hypothetical protein
MLIKQDNARGLVNSGFAIRLCFNFGIPSGDEIMFSGEPVQIEIINTMLDNSPPAQIILAALNEEEGNSV